MSPSSCRSSRSCCIDCERFLDVASAPSRSPAFILMRALRRRNCALPGPDPLTRVDFVLRCFKLMVRGFFICQVLIKRQPDPCATGCRRAVPRLGFAGRLARAALYSPTASCPVFLQLRDLPADGVQPVVVGVDVRGALEKWVRLNPTEPTAISACAAESCSPRSFGTAFAACEYSLAESLSLPSSW